MIHKGNEIKCGDFCVCFSNNILSTVKSVIHFVQRVARYDLRPNHARNEIKYGDFSCIFSDNVLSTITNVIHFECSVQLVARIIQPRYVIHDSLVACILMHDRITYGTLFNLFEHSQIRATSCTLRSTINPRTERYLTLFRHFRFRATSCTLRFWRGYKQRRRA